MFVRSRPLKLIEEEAKTNIRRSGHATHFHFHPSDTAKHESEKRRCRGLLDLHKDTFAQRYTTETTVDLCTKAATMAAAADVFSEHD